MAKKEFKQLPFFGSAVEQVGFFIDRHDPKQALVVIRKALECLKNGIPFAYFPEGTRNTDGAIHPFQKNSLRLAYMGKVPIVPLVITGTNKVMPKGSSFAVKAKVIAEIMEPINIEAYPDEETLSQSIREKMSAKKKEMEDEKSNH
jgi:1-acyl-sn-glycerol-3-phosphate acyltransferase